MAPHNFSAGHKQPCPECATLLALAVQAMQTAPQRSDSCHWFLVKFALRCYHMDQYWGAVLWWASMWIVQTIYLATLLWYHEVDLNALQQGLRAYSRLDDLSTFDIARHVFWLILLRVPFLMTCASINKLVYHKGRNALVRCGYPPWSIHVVYASVVVAVTGALLR